MPYAITVAFRRNQFEKWKNFPQDLVQDLESWSQLKDLIATGCWDVHTEYEDGPTLFRIYGKWRPAWHLPPSPEWRRERRRRITWRHFADNPLDRFIMDVQLNPHTRQVTILRASFVDALRNLEESMRLDMGESPLQFSEVHVVPTGEFDLLKSRPIAEAPLNEYTCTEQPEFPKTLSQELVENEWRPDLTLEYGIPRIRRIDEYQPQSER